ncbi:MAG: hypothetical protein A3F16_07130 [Deltaproteobacteria bacterium RIFCSPHIGHO2_12_FULL_43_9]|nr:MAG: hypothetical protein A3F16_07130 [Deltaproteobacteria bacterium RIFCSPHIGHO2_12_FULL_43_9]
MNMRKQEAGQSVVEYLLLMALMLVIAVTIMQGIRGKFQSFARGLAYRVAQPCAHCEEIEKPQNQ